MGYIKAVIFDMDGVLIDAKEWHYEALNRALAHYGFGIPRSEHLTTYDGLPTRRKLQLLSERVGFPQDLHEAVSKLKQQYTLEIAREKCRPLPIHHRALAMLRAQGFSLGVASNSIRATVDVMLGKAGLLEYFTFTLSNEDVSQPKPHPEIYLTAVARLRLQADECVVVEDNAYGVEAARRAGTHVLQVKSVDEVEYSRISAFIAGVEELRLGHVPLLRGASSSGSSPASVSRAA